jgi:hypothetical protein
MNLIWMYSILSVLLVSAVSFVGIFGMIMSAKKLNFAVCMPRSWNIGDDGTALDRIKNENTG